MNELKAHELEKDKIRELYMQRICPACNLDMINEKCVPQWAHRIPQGYMEVYGEEVIHHRFNLVLVCSLFCNARVLLNPATHPVETAELVAKIREDLKK